MTLDVTLIGPTHPFKGGIAQHTTRLAHRLADRGLTVDLVSWRHQYPRLLYPGRLTVPLDEPETLPFARTRRTLSWFAPWTWWREARRLRATRTVIVTVVTPLQALAYLAMMRTLRREGVRVVALFHNVVPHEAGRLDRAITRRVIGRADAVVVHTADEARAARDLGATEVTVAALPSSLDAWPDPDRVVRTDPHTPLELLAFGLVRPYKGLDVLLEAVALAPHTRLRVVGEFWGGVEPYERQVARLGLGERVSLEPGYVDAAAVPAIFHAADVAVYPYRSATASGAALVALDCGVPIVVSDVGGLPGLVEGDAYGLSVPPEDPATLAAALTRAGTPAELARWDANLRRRIGHHDTGWDGYADAVVAVLRHP
ncbi:glycosyltransferase family 4 protein [Demequina sp. NBRC 110055]|uniref:glycosyltransferase family 4 protein n=1 Tax=Demequina sp. NBRC 110055 TaxID=1570344 RepID=UPI0009FDE980|nr:glycosyltransferase family 4 protein [Demequina sp. NBRC 110055]